MDPNPNLSPVTTPGARSGARVGIAAVLGLVNVALGFFMAVLAMTTNGLSDLQIYAIAGAGLLLTLGSSAYALWSSLSRRAHWAFGLVGQILTLPIFVAVVMVIFDLRTTQQ